MQSANMVDRVRQEVAIHSRLKHPSILELFTFFEDADYVYLVLELGENGELQRFLKQTKKIMSEKEAAHIVGQVVDGLLYLHSHQILHRDMSLSNLLLTRDMQVKIADFGLATQLTRPDERHMTLCGTPNYISPEVASRLAFYLHIPFFSAIKHTFQCRSSHGLPADVWGLGCMLYTLLVGRGPFDTNEVKSTLSRVRNGKYTMPDHISIEAKDLLYRLLQKVPRDRISLLDVLKHPFMVKNGLSLVQTADSGILTMSSAKDISSRQPLQVLRHFRSEERLNVAKNLPKHMLVDRVKSDSMTDLVQRMDRIRMPEKRSYLETNPENQENILKPASLMGSICDQRESPACHPKLCTLRLLPMRHRTKTAILTLNDSGDVVLEFLKHSQKMKDDRIVEVVKIDSAGERISIFKPKDSQGIQIESKPVEIPRNNLDGVFKSYSYTSLPDKYCKRYLYAARFVEMVKAKTPKVTWYSPRAKCQLMETLQDFEMQFYKGGSVSLSKGIEVKIVDEVGRSVTVQEAYPSSGLSETMQNMFKYYRECLDCVLQLEKTLTNIDPVRMFPSINGRKPNPNSLVQSPRQTQSELLTPPKTPVFQMPSFAMSSALESVQGYAANQYENDHLNFNFAPSKQDNPPVPQFFLRNQMDDYFSTPLSSRTDTNLFHPHQRPKMRR